jgi:hypothetical protein
VGGSGGSTYNYSQVDADDVRRQAEQELRQQEILAGINDFLADQLRTYNDRDPNTINSRLDQIAEVLGDVTDRLDRLLFGGSIAKHTYVDGLSDVDALVVLRGEQSDDPTQLLEDFARRLRTAMASTAVTDVSAGHLAVTVTYADGVQIQLLPARERRGRLAIASEDGSGWREIRPRKFAEKLTEVNRNNNGGVVPAIKLAKGLFDRHLPAQQRLSGYHIEAIAVDAFKNYHGSLSREAILRHLVDHAAQAVLRPTSDITGQAVHIDSHLGPAGSGQRKGIAASLRRVGSKLESASSVESYEDLFRD